MDENKIIQNKWLFDAFIKMNNTACCVYQAAHNGVKQNFFHCYLEFENGVFGWIKEANSFRAAVFIDESYTMNDGWDVLSQVESEMPELTDMPIEELDALAKKYPETEK